MSDDGQGRVISFAEAQAEANEANAADVARAQVRAQAHRPADEASQPWLTWTIMGLYTALWLVMVGFGVDFLRPERDTLLLWGGNLGELTFAGQWWRLLTATFVHAGIIHLSFNLYFAWVVGRVCEQIYGPAAYALVYLGSGLIASLVSGAWQPDIVVIGASGPLCGVFGAFLGFTVQRHDRLPPEFVRGVQRSALILIGLNLALGLAIPGIDLAAPLGGLLAGLAIGYAIARLAEQPTRTRAEARRLELRAIGLVAGVVAAVLVAGAFAVATIHG